ncbi:MAG: MOSC domain-containing protein [Gammaproteobacteria bacterium]|nr:MOSC domain-containing protein [Gammaproteobacteria bacterium]
MRISSINIGEANSIVHRGKTFVTGIDKYSAVGSVFVGVDGLGNDAICDLEHHGGPDQAVYAYSSDDYRWWSDQLASEVRAGTFGDNLTIDGLPTDMNVGDRLLVRDVVLEATSPRIPCSTLAAQMQDSNFGLAFRRAERPGIYFRVLNEGEIAAGDSVTFVPNPDSDVSILDIYRLAYEVRPAAASLHAVLDAPLAQRMREKFEKQLDGLASRNA